MTIKFGNKARMAGGALFVSGMLIAVPFIADREGEGLKSYQDSVGLWSYCNGVRDGARPGMTFTKEQCKGINESQIGVRMKAVMRRVLPPIPPKTLAAHTSFAYNIGLAGYDSSQVLRLTNQNKLFEGCLAMNNWNGLTMAKRYPGTVYTIVNGKYKYNCNKVENADVPGCNGIKNRRAEEIRLCVEDLQ